MTPQILTSRDRRELNILTRQILDCRKILFFTGAGISTNLGIPDFRSSNGLRTRSIRQVLSDLDTPDPNGTDHGSPSHRDILETISPRDLSAKCTTLFSKSALASLSTATAHYRLCALLFAKIQRLKIPSDGVHALITHLYRLNKLLRCYTQNIDGVEARFSLQTDMRAFAAVEHFPLSSPSPLSYPVVQLHGDVGTARCTDCCFVCHCSPEISQAFHSGETVACPKCEERISSRNTNGKRPPRSMHGSVLRPNLVLYHEDHPFTDHITGVAERDIAAAPDGLIIVGTALKVDGARRLVQRLAESVHKQHGLVIFVNDTKLASTWDPVFDYCILMDCDAWSQAALLHFPQKSTSVKAGGDILVTDDVDDQAWLDTFFPDDS